MKNGLEIVLRSPPQRSAAAVPGEVELSPSDSRQVASDILKLGAEGLARGTEPVQRIVLIRACIPTLDDMLGASFAAWLLGGDHTLPAHAEAFARYAALARGGYSPGRVPAEFSIEGIYQAICWPFGTHLADEAAAHQFVQQWLRMADVLGQAIKEGRDPFAEQLFSESKGFAQEIVSLRSDRQVYLQDVKRGAKLWIHLPDGGRAEADSALILHRPKSLLFKHWARADCNSPTGDGYLVLGVEWDAGQWIFSTDPVQRRSLKSLAEALDSAERSKGQGRTWFDGAPFQHTLIAAPQAGSALASAEVLAAFTKWAHGHRVESARRNLPSRQFVLAAAILLVALGAAWWGVGAFWDRRPPDPSIAATELDELHVQPLESSRGTGNSSNVAMFVGINEFRNNEFPQLTFAVDDAIAQAHLFAVELKLIAPRNVVLAIQGSPGTRRGDHQLKELLSLGVMRSSAFKADILDGLTKLNHLAAPEDYAGLQIVSISSHGLERPQGACIIPHDGLRQTSEQDIFIDQLNDLMNKCHASKHLLIVDACREVPKSASRDVEPTMNAGFLEALAAAKGRKVMASCSAGQLSYEVTAKGHGIFTYWLLMGLKGQALPDKRGMITVGTIETFLSNKVRDYSVHNAPGVQQPWFSDNDGSEDIPLALRGSL